MRGWSDEELRRIDAVDEITIAPLLADGEHRHPTISDAAHRTTTLRLTPVDPGSARPG
jgi:hypothetical protein